jgi:hypothetical protein
MTALLCGDDQKCCRVALETSVCRGEGKTTCTTNDPHVHHHHLHRPLKDATMLTHNTNIAISYST